MVLAPDTRARDLRPPLLRHSVLEFGRVVLEMSSTALLAPVLRTLPRGDGHTIMTIPGFMGADGSTSRLRKFLGERGYKAIPWGLGRNGAEVRPASLDEFLEHRHQTENLIAEKLEAEFIATGRKLSLIGWSLGGLVFSGAGPPLSPVGAPGDHPGHALRGSPRHLDLQADGSRLQRPGGGG